MYSDDRECAGCDYNGEAACTYQGCIVEERTPDSPIATMDRRAVERHNEALCLWHQKDPEKNCVALTTQFDLVWSPDDNGFYIQDYKNGQRVTELYPALGQILSDYATRQLRWSK